MTKQDDLIAYLFEGRRHLLAGELRQWMDASARFTAFVDVYRDKVRKKLRGAREVESLVDLRGELEVAYCLLNDRRLEVAYEPFASAKRRGPDFAITYRANLVFNIEVARIRAEEGGAEIDTDAYLRRKEERVVRILLDKLAQMWPGMPNLLVIQTREDLVRLLDLGRLMQAVKTRADRKEAAFYAASRYSSPAAFYKDFVRLSGMVLWGGRAQAWANKQARPPLDEKVLRIVKELLEVSRMVDNKKEVEDL